MLGRIHCDPTPHHRAVEGAAENPVDLTNGRVAKAFAYVRFAHTAAPPASLRVVAWASIALVLVALMRTHSTVLNERLAVAVKTAAAQLGVERIENLDASANLAELGQWCCAKQRLDVVAVLRSITPQRRRRRRRRRGT
jgi:hypothetical protein